MIVSTDSSHVVLFFVYSAVIEPDRTAASCSPRHHPFAIFFLVFLCRCFRFRVHSRQAAAFTAVRFTRERPHDHRFNLLVCFYSHMKSQLTVKPSVDDLRQSPANRVWPSAVDFLVHFHHHHHRSIRRFISRLSLFFTFTRFSNTSTLHLILKIRILFYLKVTRLYVARALSICPIASGSSISYFVFRFISFLPFIFTRPGSFPSFRSPYHSFNTPIAELSRAIQLALIGPTIISNCGLLWSLNCL